MYIYALLVSKMRRQVEVELLSQSSCRNVSKTAEFKGNKSTRPSDAVT